MTYTPCPLNRQMHCPQDNRTCRHCTKPISPKTKLIVSIIAAVILYITMSLTLGGCRSHPVCPTYARQTADWQNEQRL